jgi:hypothetical protein
VDDGGLSLSFEVLKKLHAHAHGARKVGLQVSVPAFSFLPSLLLGSNLIATVPWVVARPWLEVHPQLATAALPLKVSSGESLELLWTGVTDRDPAARFLRSTLTELLESPDHAPTAAKNPRRARTSRR